MATVLAARLRPRGAAADVRAGGAPPAADRAASTAARVRGRAPGPAAGRRRRRLRAPRRRRCPPARDARPLHGRPDRGPHARDRRRARAAARRARRRRPPAGGGLRPRAARAGPRARRRRRHRPARHATRSAVLQRRAAPTSPRSHSRRPRRTRTCDRPSRWWSERISSRRSARDRHGQAQRTRRLALELDAPARSAAPGCATRRRPRGRRCARTAARA